MIDQRFVVVVHQFLVEVDGGHSIELLLMEVRDFLLPPWSGGWGVLWLKINQHKIMKKINTSEIFWGKQIDEIHQILLTEG